MREATADFWAGETIARLYPGSSPEDLVKHSKAAVVERCGDGVSDDHPPGKYRVNMIGRNRTLLGRIGCEGTTPDQPVCDLTGAAAIGGSGQSQTESRQEEPTPARVADRSETLSDEVRSGNPERGSEPNPVFFDAAEELMDRLTPRQAFLFISKIPNREARRAFQGIYEARYIVDPGVLRDAVYDPKTEIGIREAAFRELSNRLKGDSVKLIADAFSVRPEHAAIFEGRLRQAIQRGDERAVATTIATLLGLLNPIQLKKNYDELQGQVAALSKNHSDPIRLSIARHILWAVKQALGKDRDSNDALEGAFRARVEPELKTSLETTVAFKKQLTVAASGDESARKDLVDSLDGESVLDFISAQLRNGDEDTAVKLAKVFGRKSADGMYYLDLSSRDLGFDSAAKAHQSMRLGKGDEQIKLALKAFDRVSPVDNESKIVVSSRLQRFAIESHPLDQKDRAFFALSSSGDSIESLDPSADSGINGGKGN
jgi:hypothetical protein